MKKQARGEEGIEEESSAGDKKRERRWEETGEESDGVDTIEKIEREANKICLMLSAEQEEVVIELEGTTTCKL